MSGSSGIWAQVVDTRPTYIVNVAKGDATISDSNPRFDAVIGGDVSFFRVAPQPCSEVLTISTLRAPGSQLASCFCCPFRCRAHRYADKRPSNFGIVTVCPFFRCRLRNPMQLSASPKCESVVCLLSARHVLSCRNRARAWFLFPCHGSASPSPCGSAFLTTTSGWLCVLVNNFNHRKLRSSEYAVSPTGR